MILATLDNIQILAEQSFLVSLTFGPNVVANPYHLHILRSQFTRKLSVLFGSLHEEVVHGFEEVIPAPKDGTLLFHLAKSMAGGCSYTISGWMEIEAVPAMAKITGRASNRVLVGAPLCQNAFSFEPCCIRFLRTKSTRSKPGLRRS